jgi:type II secretory pathway component GspD/PulD (secretin)
VSTFGYLFAMDLSLELGENMAQVIADTTLNGLSGEAISFQNTSTNRYRDTEIDPDTGETKTTGVIREITSGLIIEIEGWVSGDGMITMDISTTVSKQGVDTSSEGALPPTSERIINTHVRTESGRPVIIGGLIQKEISNTENKVPGLGDIPGLGYLFKNQQRSTDMTEMVIYIVPHIEQPVITDKTLDVKLETIYNRLVREERWN